MLTNGTVLVTICYAGRGPSHGWTLESQAEAEQKALGLRLAGIALNHGKPMASSAPSHFHPDCRFVRADADRCAVLLTQRLEGPLGMKTVCEGHAGLSTILATVCLRVSRHLDPVTARAPPPVL